jgi:hypothetical protein
MTDKTFDGTAMRVIRTALTTNAFRPFDKEDWSAYSLIARGENPLIAQVEDAWVIADDRGFSVLTYGDSTDHVWFYEQKLHF